MRPLCAHNTVLGVNRWAQLCAHGVPTMQCTHDVFKLLGVQLACEPNMHPLCRVPQPLARYAPTMRPLYPETFLDFNREAQLSIFLD